MKKSIEINTSVRFCWHDAYMCLRGKHKKPFREKIIKKCEWGTVPNFYNKKNGERTMTLQQWELIKNEFLAHGIDAEKGTVIKKTH